MGYYSTVFFACKRDQHELILAATEMEPDVSYGKESSDNEDFFCCEWNHVKWGYTQEENDFENLLQEVEPKKSDRYHGMMLYPFGFARIGEEDDDITFIGDPYEFGICYRRYLEWE